MNNIHVAVIGGGCAGLSAAATLAERGYAVTLFESSSQLGGRARSVVVENKDLIQLLDNGQHILLGAYRETRRLLKKASVNETQVFERVPLRVEMQSNTGQTVFSLKSWHTLPSPFNLLMGVLCCKGLSLRERYDALRFMHHLKNTHYQITSDKPLNLFLRTHQQSKKIITLLWEPLCLAALNTPISLASTKIFLNVLKDSFTGDKHNSDFLLPRLDLSQILSHPLSNYIQSKGGTIALKQRVRSIHFENEQFSIETKNGTACFSHVIIATSPARVDKLLAHVPALSATVQQTQELEFQPIYTVYLQYPPETQLPMSMSGLSGTIAQWVFNRGRLCHQKGLLAVIISAEGKHQKLAQEELALTVAQELRRAFPHLPKPLWHKVIAEKRATFTCGAGLPRPDNKTPLPNLFLAGDYTYADYPATIEGAIRSGIQCADLISNKTTLK